MHFNGKLHRFSTNEKSFRWFDLRRPMRKLPYQEYLLQRKKAAANRSQPAPHVSPARERYERTHACEHDTQARPASPPRVLAESKRPTNRGDEATPAHAYLARYARTSVGNLSPPSPPLVDTSGASGLKVFILIVWWLQLRRTGSRRSRVRGHAVLEDWSRWPCRCACALLTCQDRMRSTNTARHQANRRKSSSQLRLSCVCPTKCPMLRNRMMCWFNLT